MAEHNFLVGTLPPDLVRQIEDATDAQRQAIATTVCKLAATRTGLEHPLIEAALWLAEAGSWGGERFIRDLAQFAEALDVEYFEAEDRHNAGLVDQETVRRLRARARAADAIVCALDPSLSAQHAIYDSIYALTADEIRACVSRVLRSPVQDERLVDEKNRHT
jgi:hypothetical protein